MKVGVVQLNSNDDIQSNFAQIKKIILESQAEQPQILFFPENSLYFRINSAGPVQAIRLDDKIITDLKELCAQTKIAIHLTTAVEENGHIYNASILIDTKYNATIVYKKIHLFDIELIGQKAIRESDSFEHGKNPSVTEYGGFKIGNSICYDVRFAELYAKYAQQQVDIILVPAAFLVKTGKAHWEVLLRARAIESQCYVIAAAQNGVHSSHTGAQSRETYGHSMLINPWGEISSVKPDGVGVIFTEISHDSVAQVRQQIPMRSHRRIDF